MAKRLVEETNEDEHNYKSRKLILELIENATEKAINNSIELNNLDYLTNLFEAGEIILNHSY